MVIMTRNKTLRLLALVLATLLALPLAGDPDTGYGGLFILWGLATVLLSSLFVALWGNGRQGRIYPSGGDL